MRHTTAKRLTATSIAGLALLGAACEAEVDEGVEDADVDVNVDEGE